MIVGAATVTVAVVVVMAVLNKVMNSVEGGDCSVTVVVSARNGDRAVTVVVTTSVCEGGRAVTVVVAYTVLVLLTSSVRKRERVPRRWGDATRLLSQFDFQGGQPPRSPVMTSRNEKSPN